MNTGIGMVTFPRLISYLLLVFAISCSRDYQCEATRVSSGSVSMHVTQEAVPREYSIVVGIHGIDVEGDGVVVAADIGLHQKRLYYGELVSGQPRLADDWPWDPIRFDYCGRELCGLQTLVFDGEVCRFDGVVGCESVYSGPITATFECKQLN